MIATVCWGYLQQMVHGMIECYLCCAVQGSGYADGERENKFESCLVQHLVTWSLHCGLCAAAVASSRFLPEEEAHIDSPSAVWCVYSVVNYLRKSTFLPYLFRGTHMVDKTAGWYMIHGFNSKQLILYAIMRIIGFWLLCRCWCKHGTCGNIWHVWFFLYI